MGYKSYSGDKMGSPLTQKHKSKKNWVDEDRNLTIDEVLESKDATAYKPYLATNESLKNRTDLTGKEKGILSNEAYDKYVKDATSAKQFSVDSMNAVRSADLSKFQDDWDYDNKSVDERNRVLKEMEKKGRWNLKK